VLHRQTELSLKGQSVLLPLRGSSTALSNCATHRAIASPSVITPEAHKSEPFACHSDADFLAEESRLSAQDRSGI